MNEIPKNNSLATRDMTSFPVSIATGLSLESLFDPRQAVYDPKREIPQRVDINKYSEIYINISTLFRNMMSSISKEAALVSSAEEFKSHLETEIDTINSLFQIEGNNVCKPIYYHCTYDKLKNNTHKAIRFRVEHTEGQRLYKQKHDKVLDLLHKSSDEYRKFDSRINPSTRVNALMITHFPWDLLSHKNFSTLDLLESNTGKLKKKYHWSSKYYPVGDIDLSKIPFLKVLLLVFGDRVLIQPSDIKLRKLITEIANRRNWTVMTTIDKVMQDFELDIKEPFVLDFLRKLH